MPLRANINYPRIDLKRSGDAIHQKMIEKVTEACKTWVISTTDVVPVLTGASKASFLKLAFHAQVVLSINPVVASRIPLGIDTSVGELIIERGKVYGFHWESDLEYIHVV